MRVLLVEDDLLTARGLRFLLEQEGFQVEAAGGATEAAKLSAEHLYDLVLLDVGLPDRDGFQVAEELRRAMPGVPMIFLTARDDEESVVRGFGLGADDYVTKPFRSRELISRIRVVLRRQNKLTEIVKCGTLMLDVKAGRLCNDGREIPLSALEYKIVELLMQNAGQIVRRERLIDEIWDYAGNVVNDNTLTVYIKRIRGKLGDAATIATVKGVGYRLEDKKAVDVDLTGVADDASAYPSSDKKDDK